MTTIFTCDLEHDGDPVSDGVEAVTFALDGTSYEIDLCTDHSAELRDAFAPFVGSAQKTGRGGASSPRRSRSGSSSSGSSSSAASSGRASGGSDREEVQRIREWARENGHKVSERGRLSSSVLEAYRAAH